MPTIGIELDLCFGARAGTRMALDDLIRFATGTRDGEALGRLIGFAAGARGCLALVPALVVFRSAMTPVPLAQNINVIPTNEL
jgi:hypothetical protein